MVHGSSFFALMPLSPCTSDEEGGVFAFLQYLVLKALDIHLDDHLARVVAKASSLPACERREAFQIVRQQIAAIPVAAETNQVSATVLRPQIA